MALSLLNNISSLIAQHNLSATSNALSTTLEQLSSGKRINSGADGPAALVDSQDQLAQIAGLNTAINNTSQAVNVVQTADGALNEVNTLLATARSLALDAANAGANNPDSLNADQSELTNIINTIQNIATTTQFGKGLLLLNGDSGVQVTGAPTGYTVNGTGDTGSGLFTVTSISPAVKANVQGVGAYTTLTGSSAGVLDINGYSISLASGTTITQAQSAINAVSAETGVTAYLSNSGANLNLVANNFGDSGNFVADTSNFNLENSLFGTALVAVSPIATAGGPINGLGQAAADAAATVLDNANSQTYTLTGSGNVLSYSGSGPADGLSITLGNSSTNPTESVGATNDSFTIQNNALVFQIGANYEQTATISLGNTQTTALGTGVTTVNANFTSLSKITINTGESDAQDSVNVIDQAISQVTELQGNLGAFQANTLQATSSNLQTALQNTTASESTITDTDFAAATSNLAQEQVLSQAGAAVLSSANQTAQLVVQLLQKLS